MNQQLERQVLIDVSNPSLISLKTQATKIISTPVGTIFLQANQFGLSHLSVFDQQSEMSDVLESNCLAHKHLRDTQQQLDEYFAGQRKQFELALAPKGTIFQREVWQALLDLKHGHTCCYADIANTINRPKAVRAVGAANGANSIAIIIPCHRVIGKDGSLTGYAYGLEMKKSLLSLEGV